MTNRRFGRKVLSIALALLLVAATPLAPETAVRAEEGGTAPLSETAGRQELNFNADWKYYKGSVTDGQSAALDDAGWAAVSLPHSTDYVMYNANDAYIGQAWYRKTFTLPAEMAGKRIFLNFGAAMQQAKVYVNGTLIATHQGGFMGFTYDVTNYVHTDGVTQDLLAVNIDTTFSGNWNPGQANVDFRYHGGLYRSVKLTATEAVHITDPLNHNLSGSSASANTNAAASGGVFIHSDTATVYSGANANMGITNIRKSGDTFTGDVSFWIGAHVQNDGVAPANVRVKNELFDPDGGSVWSQTGAEQTIAAGANSQLTTTGSIEGAKLWHPNSPYRYTLVTTVYADGAETDEYTVKTGFRKIVLGNGSGSETSGTKGTITINDELWTGLGTNTHQEIGMVGFAVPEDAAREEVRLIKDAGFDIIRLAHYPYQTAFLDACDEYGVMVQEPITGWQTAASTANRQNFAYAEATDMMRRDRNHPSIVLWELAINEANNSYIASTIVANAKLEIPTKQMITTGEQTAYDVDYSHSKNGGFASGKPNLFYEYGDWEYGGYASSSRHLRWNSSEAYLRQSVANFQTALDRSQASMLNMGFYWVWQDYTGFGEGDPASVSTGDGSRTSGRPTPCGIVDLFRVPKYAYYYAQSQRSPALTLTGVEGVRTGPMVYIATRWFDETSNAKNDVPVYTNAASVKLFGSTDGGRTLTQVGTSKTAADTQKSAEKNGTSYAQTTNYKATVYKPWTFTGIDHQYTTLVAVGYDGSGQEIARHAVTDPRTLTPAKVQLTWQSDWNSDGTTTPGRARPLVADGGDKRLVYVDIRDAEGRLISNSGTTASSVAFDAPTTNANPVTVTVTSGDAWILGGETANTPGAKSATITPRAGQAAVWVVAGHTADDTITVTATAGGLSANTLTLATVAPDALSDDNGGEPQDPSDDACLARKGTAAASSGTPALANDGKDDTVWAAANGEAGQFWQVDLRARYDIREIQILWAEAFAYRYWIQYSVNGTHWLPLLDKTANTTAEAESLFAFTNPLKSARYVRILFTEAAAQPFAVKEVHIQGESSSNIAARDVAESRPAFTTGAAEGSQASYGNDGDPARYYTAPDANAGHAWWVDMQGYYDISEITVAWRESAVHSYKLEVSADGQTWKSVLHKTRNTDAATVASSDTFSPALTGVRFARIVSGPDTQPMSFARLSVWGVESADLALGRAISADSTSGAHWPVYANDGDAATTWQPEGGGALTVDLGGAYDVSGVRLVWPEEGTRAFTLLGSSDGDIWYAYHSEATAGVWDGARVSAAAGVFMPGVRYVRLLQDTEAALARLASFEVYGAAAAALQPTAVGENVLRNPNFAANAADAVSDWEELASVNTTAAQSATRNSAATAAHNVSHGASDDRFAYFRLNSTAAYAASLTQTAAGLPDGMYEFRGWVKRGPQDAANAGPLELYAYVENYGGETRSVNLLEEVPPTAATYQQNLDNRTDGLYPYTEVVLSGIHVVNGRATVGFYMNSPGGAQNYAFLDDLSLRLIRRDPPRLAYDPESAVSFIGSLDISKNGDVVAAEYEVRNVTGAARGAAVILAAYSAGGGLISVQSRILNVPASGVTHTTLEMDGFDGGYTYKAFLWDGETLAPLTPAKTLAAVSVDGLSYSIDQGESLTLAETVTVRYNDGVRGADTAAVAWEPYGPFDAPGVFTIYGDVAGLSIRAVAMVTVKGPNLITDNPSFSSNLTGWTLTGAGLSRATSASERHGSSGGAVKFWSNPGTDTEKKLYQTRTLNAGVYVLSVWERGSLFGDDRYLQLYAAAGGQTQAYDISVATGDPWTLYEFTFTVENAGSVEYGVRTNARSQDWFQVDDFSLCQIA